MTTYTPLNNLASAFGDFTRSITADITTLFHKPTTIEANYPDGINHITTSSISVYAQHIDNNWTITVEVNNTPITDSDARYRLILNHFKLDVASF